ncbi:ExeA family protein [Desulfomarina sp.]
MYKTQFGLARDPFELTPDSNMLFLGETHKEALGVLKHGVISDKGFLLFTGEVGTGKTTLINVLAKNLNNPGYLCLISNPTLDVDDFFYYFAAQLGLLFDGNRARFLCLFAKLLEECKKSEGKVLLIIDEAHSLPTDLLEELLLLVDMSSEIVGVLSVFLVGQSELLDRLAEKQLSSLSRRIAVRYHLRQLNEPDTFQYVFFRLKMAGAGDRDLFSEEALQLVYKATNGNPRLINILCDNALLSAFAKSSVYVDGSVIRECAGQLYLEGDSAFYLPPVNSNRKKLVFAGIGTVLLLEIIVGVYLYKSGLWKPLLQFVRGIFQ